MPATLNIAVRTGDTETIPVTITDETGAAVDIAGRAYAAQIRANASDTTVLATFTCAITDGIEVNLIDGASILTTVADIPMVPSTIVTVNQIG